MYRKINSRLWNDPKIKKLDPLARYLFLYLITNEHAHLSGLYHIRMNFIKEETGLSTQKLQICFESLAEFALVYTHEDTETVWVVNMLKYQGKGQKIQRNVESHLENLHPNPLTPLFCDKYAYRIDTLSIPYRYPIDGGSDFPCPSPSPVSVPDKGGSGGERKKSRKKPETSLPPDFELTDRTWEWTRKQQCNETYVLMELEKFKAKSIAKDYRNSDWQHAFRSWMLNAIGWAKDKSTSGNSSQPSSKSISYEERIAIDEKVIRGMMERKS